jgi:hypothetical protein
MTTDSLRDFIYLDPGRVQSLAAQLGVDAPADDPQRLFLSLEPTLASRGGVNIDASSDFASWTPDAFRDGQFVRAVGVIRLLDFAFVSQSLSALPAVLRKMSKIEMEALRNSEEGRRMSKSQLQARSTENQVAIAKVEEFKMEELNEAILKLYGDVIRVKIRPSKEHPQIALIGSAYAGFFLDSRAALTQKYGPEIDADWTVVGQLNVPNLSTPPQPIPTGNQVEDAFEQIALLMSNTFRLANAPQFPKLSFTPIAMYRTIA